MLRQRVITAVVLLLVLIASLAAPGPGWFALLTLVLLAAAGWEWARLNQAGQGAAIAMAAVLAAACGASLAAYAQRDRRFGGIRPAQVASDGS
jgi:phosphatidate cytidylyltransferase